MPLPWLEQLRRLEDAIRPIARRPIDLEDLDKLLEMPDPLDEAGVQLEARELMLEILRAFQHASDEERCAMRRLVSEYDCFFRAAIPQAAESVTENLRLALMRFALIDQYPDARDAVLSLEYICGNPGIPLSTLVALRREVAGMASDEDRYGFGSTRSLLLRGYGNRYGMRGAPEGRG